LRIAATVVGVAATLFSPGTISRGIPILMSLTLFPYDHFSSPGTVLCTFFPSTGAKPSLALALTGYYDSMSLWVLPEWRGEHTNRARSNQAPPGSVGTSRAWVQMPVRGPAMPVVCPRS